jgi:competence protein ComEC
MGGLPAVLRNFHPDELWVGNNPRFGAYNALLDEAAALHVRVSELSRRRCVRFWNTQINVLAPFRDYQPGAEPGEQRFAGAACGLRRDFSDAGGRCGSG